MEMHKHFNMCAVAVADLDNLCEEDGTDCGENGTECVEGVTDC
jgi:hypothetical protein